MADPTPRKRPNFVLFITDQQRADHVGCYGNPVVRTPQLDALAARGWRADRCLCTPGRWNEVQVLTRLVAGGRDNEHVAREQQRARRTAHVQHGRALAAGHRKRERRAAAHGGDPRAARRYAEVRELLGLRVLLCVHCLEL